MSERWIRVRGSQREQIDLDLVVQALLLIGEQRWRELHGEAADEDNDGLGSGMSETEADQ
jgi:hypothetical protein